MSPRRVTLSDVAQRASVSVATVSRALSGDPQISGATRVRVCRIADSLKYVPNVAARNLVLRSSATFGLMTPDVTDPIHGQVVTGFQQQAAEHDYSVILSNGFRDIPTERRALREFAAHRVAAVAVMGSALPQREVKLLLAPSPVLFIGSEHISSSGATQDLSSGCLRPDDVGGMRQVVAHITDRGYRSVAYVSGSLGATELIRREAFVAALSARRRPKPTMYRADDLDVEGLRAIAAEISKSRPDVVVCYDDKTALLMMDELRSAGVDVPADMGIVGFDDIPFARISNPRLTTISQQSDDLGRVCVDFLLETLKRGKLPKSRLMPVALVVRESTPGPAAKTSPTPPKKGKRS
jgi:LacI family transcriptional regulator